MVLVDDNDIGDDGVVNDDDDKQGGRSCAKARRALAEKFRPGRKF